MARANDLSSQYESWVTLWHELVKRTKSPTRHVSFVIYFLVAVVIFGGLGVWTELRSYWFFIPTDEHPSPTLESVRTAIITFFPALAGSAGMQLIWAENKDRSLRAFAFFVVTILGLVIFFTAPASVSDQIAIAAGSAASAVALWTWWIANANQKELLDPINPDAATGPEDLTGDLPGDLEKFTA